MAVGGTKVLKHTLFSAGLSDRENVGHSKTTADIDKGAPTLSIQRVEQVTSHRFDTGIASQFFHPVTLPVDNDKRGDSAYSQKGRKTATLTERQQDMIAGNSLNQVRPCLLIGRAIGCQIKINDIFTGQFSFERDHLLHGYAARRAPGLPEIHQDNLTPIRSHESRKKVFP